MILLAIETSTDACSCALLTGRDEPVERWRLAPRRHAEILLGMVDDVLEAAGHGLDAVEGIAVGRGPGSFTGVRIGIGVVQGLAFGIDVPVAPVSTLAALALAHHRAGGARRVVCALDARKGEVYAGSFEVRADGDVREVVPEAVCAPECVRVPEGRQWEGAGPGWEAHGEALRRRIGAALGAVDARALPRARDVATIGRTMFARGETVPAHEALPVYLRDRVTGAPRRTPHAGE